MNPPFSIKEEIGRFDVTVDDPFAVGLRKGRGNFPSHAGDLLGSPLAGSACDRASLHQRHAEVGATANRPGRMDRDNVIMDQARGGFRFDGKSGDPTVIETTRIGKNFDRHTPAKRFLNGLENPTLGPGPQFPGDQKIPNGIARLKMPRDPRGNLIQKVLPQLVQRLNVPQKCGQFIANLAETSEEGGSVKGCA